MREVWATAETLEVRVFAPHQADHPDKGGTSGGRYVLALTADEDVILIEADGAGELQELADTIAEMIKIARRWDRR